MRPTTRYPSICLTLAAVAALVGCSADATTKGEESDAPVDGKLDSFRRPTDRGEAALGRVVSGVISEDALFHAWFVVVTGEVKASFTTARPSNAPEVDTVLYLYKENDDGSFGRYLSRNDDAETAPYSSLTAVLEEGNYRVLVKGHDADDLGPFILSTTCEGESCPAFGTPEPESRCAFGRLWPDLEHSANVELVSSAVFEPEGDAPEGLVLEQIAAIIDDDVTTAEEAFEHADDSIYLDVLRDRRTGALYHAFEYYSGDTPVGGIVLAENTTLVATMSDQDLFDCTIMEAEDQWSAVQLSAAEPPRALASFRSVKAASVSGLPAETNIPFTLRDPLLRSAEATLGDPCEAISLVNEVEALDANELISRLGNERSMAGWVDQPTGEQLSALAQLFVPHEQPGYDDETVTVYDEAERFQILAADIEQQGACEAAAGRIFFIHDRADHQVLYLTLRQY